MLVMRLLVRMLIKAVGDDSRFASPVNSPRKKPVPKGTPLTNVKNARTGKIKNSPDCKKLLKAQQNGTGTHDPESLAYSLLRHSTHIDAVLIEAELNRKILRDHAARLMANPGPRGELYRGSVKLVAEVDPSAAGPLRAVDEHHVTTGTRVRSEVIGGHLLDNWTVKGVVTGACNYRFLSFRLKGNTGGLKTVWRKGIDYEEVLTKLDHSAIVGKTSCGGEVRKVEGHNDFFIGILSEGGMEYKTMYPIEILRYPQGSVEKCLISRSYNRNTRGGMTKIKEHLIPGDDLKMYVLIAMKDVANHITQDGVVVAVNITDVVARHYFKLTDGRKPLMNYYMEAKAGLVFKSKQKASSGSSSSRLEVAKATVSKPVAKPKVTKPKAETAAEKEAREDAEFARFMADVG